MITLLEYNPTQPIACLLIVDEMIFQLADCCMEVFKWTNIFIYLLTASRLAIKEIVGSSSSTTWPGLHGEVLYSLDGI